MADAIFTVAFAGPLVTVQDAGRPGRLRFGVTASGPMDRLAFDAAHAALGADPGGAQIETSLGGVTLVCDAGAVTLAVAGGAFEVDLDGRKGPVWTVLTIRAGQRLSLRAGATGAWASLAFAGRLETPLWLGAAATHSTSGFGGGALRAGQILTVRDAAIREEREGDFARPQADGGGPIRVVLGPQDHCFKGGEVERFLTSRYRVSGAVDRMGMRLEGPALALDGALSIPSEPILRGAVQVSGDGAPTILGADHQTTGGYPKIATIISADLDRAAQLRAGDALRFAAVSPDEALALARSAAAARRAYLDEIAIPRGTLAQRLMRENLNHGLIED